MPKPGLKAGWTLVRRVGRRKPNCVKPQNGSPSTHGWSLVRPEGQKREGKRALGHDMGLEKSEESGAQRICSAMVQKGELRLVDYV